MYLIQTLKYITLDQKCLDTSVEGIKKKKKKENTCFKYALCLQREISISAEYPAFWPSCFLNFDGQA